MSMNEDQLYIQTHDSNSSGYAIVNSLPSKPNMDTKASESLLQFPPNSYPDVKNHQKKLLSYHKLRISFIFMVVLNLLLMVSVVICLFVIVPHLSTPDRPSKPEAVDLTGEKSHMKCKAIKQRLTKIYRNGQMMDDVKPDDKCSMEDLLDSFIQHVEDSMRKEKSNRSCAFHLVSNNTEIDRCQDSRTLYCLKKWAPSINTTKITINDENIVVPSSGAYFLYSRVIINAKINSNLRETDTIKHSIRYSNTGYQFKDLESSSIKCGVIQNTMSHISYIEKIQYLEKDSILKVSLDLPYDVSMQPSVSGGAFGMFKL